LLCTNITSSVSGGSGERCSHEATTSARFSARLLWKATKPGCRRGADVERESGVDRGAGWVKVGELWGWGRWIYGFWGNKREAFFHLRAI